MWIYGSFDQVVLVVASSGVGIIGAYPFGSREENREMEGPGDEGAVYKRQ